MKIRNFSINGFGIFSNAGAEELSGGLNVFVGDNEAGKSSLLGFFRAIFFGFETGVTRGNPYKPVNGGEHGGAATVLLRDGAEYRIERLGKPGAVVGQVSVRTPSGDVRGDDALGELLPGVTKDLYRNVFAFSLDELQTASTLEADAVRNRIYSYGAGAGQISAVDVEHRIAREMDDLFRPRGQKLINTEFSTLDQIGKRVKELSSQSAEYHEKRRLLTDLDAQIASLDRDIDALRTRLQRLEQLSKAWPHWSEYLRAERELAGMRKLDSFPQDGLNRLEQCKKTCVDLMGRLVRVRADLESEQARLTSLAVDRALVEHADGIESIAAEKAHYESAYRDLPALETAARLALDAADASLRQLGEGWDAARVQAFDNSSLTIREVMSYRDRLNSVRQSSVQCVTRLEEAMRDYEAKKDDLIRAEQALAGAGHHPDQTPDLLSQKEEALRGARTAVSRLESVRLRRQNADARKMQAEQLMSDRESDLRQRKPASIMGIGLALGGVLAVLGVVLLASGALKAAGSVPLIFCGVLVAAGLALAQRGVAQGHASFVQRCQDEIDSWKKAAASAEQDITLCISEQDQLERTLQTSGSILGRAIVRMEDLDPVESELGKAREQHAKRSMLSSQLDDKRRESDRSRDYLARISEQEKDARESARVSERQWTAWLTARSLPTSLTPDAALDMLSRIEIARERIAAGGAAKERAAEVQTYLDDFESRAGKVLMECGRQPSSGPALIGAVSSLGHDLAETRSCISKRDEIESNIRRLQREVEALLGEQTRSEDAMHALLAAGEAADEEEFRRNAALHSRGVELDQQVRDLETRMELIAGAERLTELKTSLAAADEVSVSEQFEQAQAAFSELETARREQIELRGRTAQEIESLERNDELSAALQEQQVHMSRAQEGASKWAALAICREVMGRAREQYEREKQPRVVQTASDFLSSMTSGRYARVFSPLGQNEVQLETPDGQRKSADILSRGTKEQLYLALRFGLICEYGRNAEPLPVLMDDILVNFDPGRTTAAAESIVQLAQSNQIIFFTCHPETAQLFREIDSTTRRYEVRGGEIVG